MIKFIDLLGRVLHSMPDWANRGLCVFVAFYIMTFMRRRRKILLSNIAKAFPDMSGKQVRAIAWESAARTAELGIFVLVSPHMKDAELFRRFTISNYVKEQFEMVSKNPRPVLLLIPHLTMLESVTILPHILGDKIPPTGVFYRPFGMPWLEDWVKKTRERFNIRLLSRKDSLSQAFEFLRGNGCVAMLFDQNSGSVGAVKYLFGRLTSTSGLSGVLAEKFKTDVFICYPRRTAFWKAHIDGLKLSCGDSAEEVVLAADAWLEKALSEDAQLRDDWLWMHGKWNMHHKGCMFSIRHRLDYISADALLKGYRTPPKKSEFAVVLPDNFGELLISLPFIRTLRKERFDSFFTAYTQNKYAEFVRYMRVSDKTVGVDSGVRFVASIVKIRRSAESVPDYTVLFENGKRAGLIAKSLNAIQTLGFGKKKRFSCTVTCTADLSAPRKNVFGAMFDAFSVSIHTDFSPFNSPAPSASKIAVVARSFEGFSASKICARIREEFPETEFVEIFPDPVAAARELSHAKCAIAFDSLSASFVSLFGTPCVVCADADFPEESFACVSPRKFMPLRELEKDVGAAVLAARNF